MLAYVVVLILPNTVTVGDFTFWISLSLSLSLSPKFGLSES